MSSRRRPASVLVLLALLFVEFALVAGYALFLLVELLIDTPSALSTAIALTVLVVIAAAWLGAIVVGVWRGSGWTRGAALVWQVLQFALGVGALQGAFAQPAWGWPLLLVALLSFVLLLTKRVTAWTRGQTPREEPR